MICHVWDQDRFATTGDGVRQAIETRLRNRLIPKTIRPQYSTKRKAATILRVVKKDMGILGTWQQLKGAF
jgi:hypothetical protein